MPRTLDQALADLRQEIDQRVQAPDLSWIGADIRRRRRRRAGYAAGGAAVAAAAAVLLISLPHGGGGGQTTFAAEITAGLGCPEASVVLPPQPGDADRLRAVMDRIVETAYAGDPQHAQYTVVALALAPAVPGWGQIVQANCAPAVYQDTWVVQLHFPAFEPSASLSGGQVFVTRTRQGLVAWNRYH